MQPEICASTGSACNSEYPQASHVLSAIGLTEAEATSSLRFSFGRYNDAAQIDRAIEIIHQQLTQAYS
jgi:cysteine desulfurase